MNLEAVKARKHGVRDRVWARMEQERVARFPGARGRIPNFVGAERAAGQLAELPEWRAARVVKANPDAPQLPVRRRALDAGKVVYMAVPRLRAEKPFVRLRREATIRGAMKEGESVAMEAMERVDLVVCGTVAVNRVGARIGKGGGYSDLELGLLVEAGLVDDATLLATTVHPLQVRDEPLPELEHDFRVDVIVTPDEVLRTRKRRRPQGILPDYLDDDKIRSIPVLAARGLAAGRPRPQY